MWRDGRGWGAVGRRVGVVVDPRRAWVPWSVVLAVVVAMVACSPGGGDGSDAGTPVGGGATPGGGSPMAAGLVTPVVGTLPLQGTPGGDGFRTTAAEGGAVVWATVIDPTTKEPRERVAAFRPDARTIYAAVPLARLEPGTTLTASWTYNRTPLEGMVGSVTAPPGETARDLWVAFGIARQTEEPWPAGIYAIVVAVNGEPVLTAEVEVQDASSEG